MFQLGRHGEVKGGTIVPIRSSSALVLSSTDINRNRIYVQQPPISAAGFSSQAFSPHFPHTVRTTEKNPQFGTLRCLGVGAVHSIESGPKENGPLGGVGEPTIAVIKFAYLIRVSSRFEQRAELPKFNRGPPNEPSQQAPRILCGVRRGFQC